MSDFSLSRTAKLLGCAYPFRPDVDLPTRESGYRARIGTLVQAAATAFVRGEKDVLTPEAFERAGIDAEGAKLVVTLAAKAIVWLEAKGARGQWVSEAKLAWSPSKDRARVLPPTFNEDGTEKLRDYSAKRGDEVCGSVDFLEEDVDWVHVVDLKTGETPLETYEPQVRALCVAAARMLGVSAATWTLVKIPDEGEPYTLSGNLDDFELDAFAGELAERLAGIAAANPEPGSHCNDLLCDLRPECPVTHEAISQLVPAEALVPAYRMTTKVQGPRHALWMMDRLRMIEAAAKAVKDAIKAAVPEGGWELDDGARLVEATRKVPRFDKKGAIAWMRAHGATDFEIAACTYTWEESAGLRVVGGSAPKRTRKGKAV